MERPPFVSGMDLASAKEYLFGLISTLKLTEKGIQDIDIELSKWKSRVELAKSREQPDLALEAEKEVELLKNKWQRLITESDDLKFQIEETRRQLPQLEDCERSASIRSIDPDLLEQELLITAGYLPGEEENVRKNRLFDKMEKDAAAEAALSELKAKLEKKS